MDWTSLVKKLIRSLTDEPVPPRKPAVSRKPAAKRPASGSRRKPAPPASRRSTGTVRTTGLYSEESIFRTADQLLMETPEQIRRMRTLSEIGASSQRSMEAVFYRQGKFMEHFTDDYADPVPCRRANPMYFNLRDGELRTYFTWRTRYRQGALPETDSGYLMLFCCEIINGIGVQSPAQGYDLLEQVLADYGETHPDIRRLLLRWMPDYAAYYEQPLRNSDPRTAAMAAVLRHTQQTPADFLAALDALSCYHILKSKLYEAHPAETAEIVYAAYHALLLHYAEKKNASFPAYLLGNQKKNAHFMFEGGVFYETNRVLKREIRLSPLCTYRCYGGQWSVETFCSEPDSVRIGAFLRTVDSLLRVQMKFRSKLKPGSLPEGDADVIAAAIDAYFAEQARKNAPVITLDAGELEKIRQAAEHTTDMLTLPEDGAQALPEGADPPADAPDNEEDDAQEMPDLPLSKPALALLICLVTGQSVQPLVDAGQMLSVLADEINEALYDRFGDTVLETGEDGNPVPVPDYFEDLKGMLEG